MNNFREKAKLVIELLLVLPIVAIGGWLWTRTGGLAETIVGGSFIHDGLPVTSYTGINMVTGAPDTVSAFVGLQNMVVKGIFWVVAIAVVGWIIYKLVKHNEVE